MELNIGFPMVKDTLNGEDGRTGFLRGENIEMAEKNKRKGGELPKLFTR